MSLQDSSTELVYTSDGPVRGVTSDGMRKWLGIPYAAPPVGQLRWMPPVPPEPWAKPHEATNFGPICAQEEGSFPGFGHNSLSEDCLYLNVFAPESKHEALLPVMVWLHGGGLFQGASNDYNPQALVQHGNVIVVSLNYRVNLFGFFSHPSINNEGHEHGNYGFMDQQAALEWIKHNIDKFGGDANNVTIFGESAGAISVSAHLTSPGSKGLFHKAIIQSGGSPITFPHRSVTSFEQIGVALAKEAGCAEQTSTNLRSLSTKQMVDANSIEKGTFGTTKFPFGLMEDGVVIPHNMKQRFLAGNFNHVPLIIGVTKDEFAWFQGMIELATGTIVPRDSYTASLRTFLEVADKAEFLGVHLPPSAFDDVLQRYPMDKYTYPGRAIAAAIGDAGIISTSGRRAARVIKSHVHGVYTYEFSVDDAPVSWPAASFPYGSAHAQELQFLFPGFRGASGKGQSLTKEQEELAAKMVLYWTNFARTGSPSSKDTHDVDLPTWTVYDTKQDNTLLLQAPLPKMVSSWGQRHHMDFWDTFYVQ
ncbi:alpha/beta-hydrolase [Pochonia chlamydosporia 170]|uniref:Carboxylic ester hydrolase n=1 Tax=Pochonia chlamydosporia 170 TaxID=1380566 RepID=A0A179FL19_METCM|nr:alpha/beta-hydrolase [Pochonia chlamydosporia 170]OAQ66038.1 alpha/beta-hydrolase [Pochonia chlamydosporia 170]